MMRKLLRIFLLRRADIRQMFLTLGCTLICWNFLSLLVIEPAWGNTGPGRAIFANGKVHCHIETGSVVPDKTGFFPCDVGHPEFDGCLLPVTS